ncbi:rhodanese-like domain-containing protein [Streptomyces sp. DSM 41033]|uniref:rhodanese-like domain-containing protein n=1 Tax=Streptomyces sp. DSM 41033 TaxID=3448655 RepID=UPI00404008F5
MFLFRRSQPRVSVDQAHDRTSGETPDAVLLDVREKSEWNAGHAPGAVHVPLSKLVAGANLPAEASDRSLVVICRSGHRSQQAAKLLTERGQKAVDVKGGMNAWAAAGHPVLDERGNSGRIA